MTTPDSGSRRRRSPLLIVGLVLVLAGVGLLGYVAWQYWGTNIVSKRQQEAVASDLMKSWEDPAVRELLGPEEGSDLGDALAIVRIPRFGDDFAVPVIEGVRPEDLSQGLGHYPGTSKPGDVGNFAVAGHRVTHGEPFRDLPQMRAGDKVIVETANATYTYAMNTDPNDLIVQPDDTWVLDPIPGEGRDAEPDQARITLTTCAELFHSSDRMIAFGHLVDTERKS